MSISTQLSQTGGNATGSISDQVCATNLLQSAKSGVTSCATMTTESATPEMRAAFQRFLQDHLRIQEELSKLMTQRGWYHPKANPQEQVRYDLEYASRANVLQ